MRRPADDDAQRGTRVVSTDPGGPEHAGASGDWRGTGDIDESIEDDGSARGNAPPPNVCDAAPDANERVETRGDRATADPSGGATSRRIGDRDSTGDVESRRPALYRTPPRVSRASAVAVDTDRVASVAGEAMDDDDDDGKSADPRAAARHDEEEEASLRFAKDLRHQAQQVWLILFPVTACIALVVWAVKTIAVTGMLRSGYLAVYTVSSDASAGQMFVGALTNALIFMGAVIAATLLVVILFVCHCFKVGPRRAEPPRRDHSSTDARPTAAILDRWPAAARPHRAEGKRARPIGCDDAGRDSTSRDRARMPKTNLIA
jgi:hypothetical protein